MPVVGRATILVAPSLKGFQKDVGDQVNTIMPGAGKDAGTAMATGMANGVAAKAGAVKSAAGAVAAGASGAVAGAGATAATGFGSRLSAGLGKATSAVGSAASKIGSGISATVASAGTLAGSGFVSRFKSAVAPMAGVFTAVGIGSFLKGSIDEASGLSESINALNVSFGDASGGVQKLGRSAADNLGLSNLEFNNLAVRFSAFSKTIAGEGGNVVGTLDDLTTRASDFASVMNLDVSEAAELFQSGLAGETEPLRKYGIDLSAAAVEAYALANGISDGSGEMTEAQKVQARYGALMQQTAQTHGDFANTSDGLANQQRILASRWADMRAELGERLLPAVNGFVAWINTSGLPALKSLAGFVVENKDAVIALATGVGVAVTALLAFKVLNTVKAWIAATTFAQKGLNAAMRANALGIVITAIGLLVAGLVYAYQNSETFRNVVQAAWDGIKAAVGAVVDWFTGSVVPFLKTVWDGIAAGATWLWQNVMQPVWGGIKAAAEAVVTWFTTSVVPFLGAVWEGIKSGVSTVGTVVSGVWTGIQTAVGAVVGWFTGTVVPFFQGIWSAIGAGASWLWTGVLQPAWAGIQAGWAFLVAAVQAAWEGILKPAWDAVAAAASWLWTTVLSPIFTGIWNAWSAMAGFIYDIWVNVIKLAWDLMAAGIQWLWENALSPIFEGIKAGWQAVAQWFSDRWLDIQRYWDGAKVALQAAWAWIDLNVFAPLRAAFAVVAAWFRDRWLDIQRYWDGAKVALQAAWAWIDLNVFAPLRAAWALVADWFNQKWMDIQRYWDGAKVALKAGWDYIKSAVFDAFNAGIEAVRSWFNDKVAAVVVIWEGLKAGFKAVWDWIDANVFGSFKAGLDKVRGWVEDGVKSIGTAFRAVANVFRLPINFIINDVWNGGIKKAFDNVAVAIGSKARLPHADDIPAFAKGGRARPGWALVGEEGPELIDLATPGRVYTAAETAAALAQGKDLDRDLARRAAGRRPSEALAPMGDNIFSRGWEATKSAVSSAVSWVRGGLASAAAAILDPLKRLIGGTVSQWGPVGGLAGSVVTNAMDSLIGWIRGKDAEAPPPGQGGAEQGGPPPGPGGWRRPSRGPITSRFGNRWGRLHAGIDVAGGGPTFAANAGTVFRTGAGILGGRTGLGIGISHGGGVFTYYGHNPVGGIQVRPGQQVKAGQHIGYQGATGNVTGVHLHFELHRGGWGRAVNPESLNIFDGGNAWLEPGMLAYHSASMRTPDAVLSSQQFADMHRLANQGMSNSLPDHVVLRVGNREFDAYVEEVSAPVARRETQRALTTAVRRAR